MTAPVPAAPDYTAPSIVDAGLKGLCPRCGAKTLFGGIAQFTERCANCGLDFSSFNVGDGPAAFLTLILGTIIVIACVAIQLKWDPPLWVQMLIWIPVTGAAVLGSLRLAKGALLAAEYRNRARQAGLREDRPVKRVPIIPTILVGLAIAIMIGLGAWQLQRRSEKAALLQQLARNERLAPIAFPRIPIGEDLLFRRAGAFCLEPVAWRIEGGRTAAGGVGWRRIAECRTGAEGPGFAVQLGLSSNPNGRPTWRGGQVNGYITHAIDHRPIIANLFSPQPPTLMLVSDTPLAGLTANPPPNLDAVPNNHLAYAVQWFLFAGIAAIIYAIALWRRAAPAVRRKPSGDPLPDDEWQDI